MSNEQFKPNTTVATIVTCQDKFLLVEEIENGKHVFNQPAGHIEAKENLIDAAKRELHEETNISAEPEYLSGIYYFHRPDLSLYYLRFCFVVHFEAPPATSPNDSDIIATHWLTYEEVIARKSQLRSPMVLECIDDYLAGNKISLSTLKTNI